MKFGAWFGLARTKPLQKNEVAVGKILFDRKFYIITNVDLAILHLFRLIQCLVCKI
jgi:hypothetical protein